MSVHATQKGALSLLGVDIDMDKRSTCEWYFARSCVTGQQVGGSISEMDQLRYGDLYHSTTGPMTMVGEEFMAQESTNESFYEEVISKGKFLAKSDLNCNIELQDGHVTVSQEEKVKLAMPSYASADDHGGSLEDSENIYEIIPGDTAPQNKEYGPMTRSMSFGSSTTKKESILRKSEKLSKTLHESNSAPPSPSHSTPDLNSTQYAEVIHTNKVTDFVPSRPTRESQNPILRQDFSGNLSFMPNLRDLRKHLTEVSQDRYLEQRGTKTTPSTTPECTRKPSETSQRSSNSGVSSKSSPNHSPRSKESPGPLYVNMEFAFVDDDKGSRRSSGSSISINERQSVSSTEDANRETEDSHYENMKGLTTHESGRPRQGSTPVDIVYSDLHFHESRRSRIPRLKLDKTVSTLASSTHEKLSVETRSHSLPTQSNPKLSPCKDELGDPRPKSNSLGKLSGGELGFYVARFVKRTTVQRSNAKTLQATIHDIVSKTKVEDCSSVNVEVTSDMMRISTNCSPWEVIASFDVENIGVIDLFEQDHTTLGVIVCTPEADAECYVMCCPDAQLICSAVKNAFNSSNPKSFKVPVSTPVGPESWLGEDDVTTFSGVSYLGALKVKKSYLLINESITSLLEKAHPKEFKNVFLEVHPEQIRIIDAQHSKILHQHTIPWILLLGVYEEDTRLFGYIVSEARQGEKTRMFCHAFRCSRITSSVAATEAIRLGCQATYSDRRDSVRSSRRISFTSNASNCSGSQASSSSPPPPEDFGTLAEEDEIRQLDSKHEKPKHKEKEASKSSTMLKRFASMPHLIRPTSKKDKEHKMEQDMGKNVTNVRTASASSAGADDVFDSTWEIVPEEKVYNFNVTYLCSTVVNPPLRPKHLRECVKQYQKQQAKSLKKFGKEQPSSEVVLSVSVDGVEMTNPRAQKEEQGMFFPFDSVSNSMAHPEIPEYFAFATIVTGDSKHKCHLFRQTTVPSEELVGSFKAFM